MSIPNDCRVLFGLRYVLEPGTPTGQGRSRGSWDPQPKVGLEWRSVVGVGSTRTRGRSVELKDLRQIYPPFILGRRGCPARSETHGVESRPLRSRRTFGEGPTSSFPGSCPAYSINTERDRRPPSTPAPLQGPPGAQDLVGGRPKYRYPVRGRERPGVKGGTSRLPSERSSPVTRTPFRSQWVSSHTPTPPQSTTDSSVRREVFAVLGLFPEPPAATVAVAGRG